MECKPVNDTLSAGKGDDNRKGRRSVETYVVLGVIISDYLASVASSSKSALAMREGRRQRGGDTRWPVRVAIYER